MALADMSIDELKTKINKLEKRELACPKKTRAGLIRTLKAILAGKEN